MSARPNIVLFMTDQQRADTVGALGSSVAITPHYDAHSARGTGFVSAFGQHSACSQSRASIMTGWYPHTAGHRTLDNLLKPWEPNLLRTFRDSGYHVVWAGARGDTFAPGVTEASTDFAGFTTLPDRAWLDTVLAAHQVRTEADRVYLGAAIEHVGPTFDEATVATALDLLHDGMPEPWLLFVALEAPHPPFGVREPWRSLHERAAMPARLAAPAGGKPAFMAELRRRYGWDDVAEETWREVAAVYHGMVSATDDAFGRVLEAVDAVSDRHVVATFTDHGEYLGDFGLVEKWPSGLDECLLRNPLIISVPDGVEGQICDALVEMVDLLPTLAEYGEVELPHAHFGRSLGPLLRGETTVHRDAVFADGGFRPDEAHLFERADPRSWYAHKAQIQHDHPEMVGTASVLRTTEWTYVRRRHESDELYDRAADPRETTNLIDDPALAVTVAALRDRTLDWLHDTTAVLAPERDPRFTFSLFDGLT